MEGLAKTAQVSVSVPSIVEKAVTHNALGDTDVEALPIDMYKHFGVDFNLPEKDVNKLRDIYKWSSTKAHVEDRFTLGNVMENIRNLEVQLGVSTNGQPLYDKLWNWVSMENKIDDMRKRQRSI